MLTRRPESVGGEFYDIARHRWLTIQTTVSKVIDWRLASSKPVEIHDKR